MLRGHVGIIRNEHTRSTPFDPKLTFWCISYYLGAFGSFGSLTKLGDKRAELVQKFVPRSCVGFFRNERTRSTPLDPKLKFWCILYYLGAFGTIWLRYEIRSKMGRTSAKFRATKSSRNFSQRTHPIHPIASYIYVLVRFVLFGCIWDSLVALQHSVQNEPMWCFMPRSRVRIFRNERTRSTPLDSKHMFWCVLYYLDAFGTVWLP